VRSFVQIADAIGGTSKKLEKVRLIGEFLKSLSATDAAIAARFLAGRVFAGHDERALGVGAATLSRVIAERLASQATSSGLRIESTET